MAKFQFEKYIHVPNKFFHLTLMALLFLDNKKYLSPKRKMLSKVEVYFRNIYQQNEKPQCKEVE